MVHRCFTSNTCSFSLAATLATALVLPAATVVASDDSSDAPTTIEDKTADMAARPGAGATATRSSIRAPAKSSRAS